MKLFSDSKNKKKDKDQPIRANVSVDGAGIITVKSKAVLKSRRGQAQLRASRSVPIVKCG